VVVGAVEKPDKPVNLVSGLLMESTDGAENFLGVYPNRISGPEKRADSVQRRVIDALLAEGEAHQLIFDDDGAGEIADVRSLRVMEGLVQVTLYHCTRRHPVPASKTSVKFADKRRNQPLARPPQSDVHPYTEAGKSCA
jgi:hypothetical protein